MDAPETEQEKQQRIVDKLKQENPGTELWLGGHPKTGDWWVYRPPTKTETKAFRKFQRLEREKGPDGDLDVGYEVLVLGGTSPDSPPGCVMWPPKKSDDKDQETLYKLLLRRPMLAATMAGEICEVGGVTDEAIQKKL